MTNIKFPRKEFEKNLKITKEIEEKFPLFGTPIENINENEIEIAVTPNRPELISMHNFIRDFKKFLGKDLGLKKYTLKKPKPNYEVKVNQNVKDVRPYTVCAIVENLKFDDARIKEIIEIQEKLHITLGRNRKKVAIGIYPLEKISLPIKYEALPPEKIKFIPLDEKREMNGHEILKMHQTGKEFAHLLQNFSVFPIFKDAKEKILSMPPVINSEETGKVTEQTKDIFIECSGSNLETLNNTLNIIITTLAEMGGTICQVIVDYGNKKIITPYLSPKKIKISIENANSILGLSLKEKEIEKLLSKMGYDYQNKTAIAPAWRTDILHEVDVIEDIAIAYGYENFSPEIPKISTIGEESKLAKIERKISEILIGLEFLETKTYHLIKKEELELSNLEDAIEVENSKTEYKILRPNLFIPALRTIAENKDKDYPQLIFEIGTIFKNSRVKNLETDIQEEKHLVIAAAPANITKIKQILDYLSNQLNIAYEIKESIHSQCAEGRTASIYMNNKQIGFMGEVHPETLQRWNIKMPLAVLEISLEEIFNSILKEN